MTREEAASRFAEKAEDHYYVPKLRELYQMAAEALREPPVIRCEDCKYWEKMPYSHRTDGACAYIGIVLGASHYMTEKDHFCGYAERREAHD